MNLDCVIKGGTLVTDHKILRSDIGIKDGLITIIASDLQAENLIDANSCLILPGAIDPHVHLEMKAGNTCSSDSWETGTIAAACGGTTTIIDFVEPEVDQSLLEALDARLKQAEAQACIDFGLHMTIPPSFDHYLTQLSDVMDSGITSFKHYTTYQAQLSDSELIKSFCAIKNLGGLPMIHCENDAIIQWQVNSLIKAGLTGPENHPYSRPVAAEREAIERVLALAETVNVPIYIAHVSSKDAIDAINRSVSRGLSVFAETCPQYLLLNNDVYNRPDFEAAKYVCAPPIRTPNDNQSLWFALNKGVLQIASTDHCPFNFLGQKELGRRCFADIPGGLPGIELRLALLYTFGVLEQRISLDRWVEVCCTEPAKIFGLYPKKGTLTEGSDADIVIFDPQAQVEITHSILHENVDYTPYEGFNLIGFPTTILFHGQVIVREGKFVGKKGMGRFLHRNIPYYH